MGCLAVIAEDLDVYSVSATVPDAVSAGRFSVESTFLLPPSAGNVSSDNIPSLDILPSWLQTQIMGENFHDERKKRAAWALGHLPPLSYFPLSTTFKYVEQQWSSQRLSSGNRQVVELVSGKSALPSFVQLKLCFYHPANAGLMYELICALEQNLTEACEISMEVWLIAVFEALSTVPDFAFRKRFFRVYCGYTLQTLSYQVTSFKEAGHHELLHACLTAPCPHSAKKFCEVHSDASILLQQLVDDSLIELNGPDPLRWPSIPLRKLARQLGLLLYGFQSSYILLQPYQQYLYDSTCREKLNLARAELSSEVAPLPCLVWNGYIPHDTYLRIQSLLGAS